MCLPGTYLAAYGACRLRTFYTNQKQRAIITCESSSGHTTGADMPSQGGNPILSEAQLLIIVVFIWSIQ
jgi:hypothetical protein